MLGSRRTAWHALQMLGLLVWLLSLGLPLDQTASRTKRQDAIECYTCEEENSFACTSTSTCSNNQRFCVIAAMKIFPRFFLVSKQCSESCPIIEVPADPVVSLLPNPKSFLMEKPLPFLYARCCRSSLCNLKGIEINGSTFRAQVGRASERKCGLTGLLLLSLLVLTAAALVGVSLL